MKITQIYNYLAPPATGGHRYEEKVARVLGSLDGARFRRVSLHETLCGWRRYVMPLENLRAVGTLRSEDLVIFNSSHYHYMLPLMMLTRKVFNGKMAVTHHHFEGFSPGNHIDRLRAKMERRMLAMADIIIAPSEYVSDTCRGLWPDKTIWYWPIPFEKVSGKMGREPEDLTDTACSDNRGSSRIVAAGSIEPRKGYHRLLQAVSLLRKRGVKTDVRIAGRVVSEEYAASLRRYATENELNVQFVGYLSEEDKRSFYCSGDIYAMTSTTEGFGIVMAEAMGEGLPVVAFANTAIPYLVKDGVNGLLADEGDIDGYADALELLASDADLRRRMSKGALMTRAALPTPDDFRLAITGSLESL